MGSNQAKKYSLITMPFSGMMSTRIEKGRAPNSAS